MDQDAQLIASFVLQIPRNLRVAALIESIHRSLTAPQLLTLFILNDSSTAGLSMSEIADDLAVSMPTATGIVDRLVREGLVSRRASPDDRRIVLIGLTPRGRSVFRRMLKMLEGTIARLLSRMGKSEREATVQAAERFHRLSMLIQEEDRHISAVSA